MWEQGVQKKKKKPYTNSDLAKVEGFLEEKDAMLWLEKFFRENISILSKILTGVELLPFQSMMIKAMFNTDYFLAICSRGAGKSFICAIFIILYATLNQGVKIGIIANSFRQSRLLVQKILDLKNDPKAAFLSKVITHESLKPDEWVIEFGRSKLYCLPMGTGDKLRGYRFKVMVIDELLLLPSKIINEVIMPFLSTNTDVTERKKVRDAEDILISQGKLKEEDRIEFGNNKLIGLSSASYSFEYLYTMYKQYENSILNGDKIDARYGIFHLSYESLPKELYDQALITSAKAQLSEAQFAREFLSRFTDDSSGYFKMSKMMACTYPDGEGQSVMAMGDKDGIFVLSVDSSWSESDSSDDFVMHVIKYFPETEIGVVVHSYALHGTAMKEHIKYFHFLYKAFSPELVVMDYNGGVQFLAAANESELFKSEGIEIKTIDVDTHDPVFYNDSVKQIRNAHSKSQHKVCLQIKPLSDYIRRSNELLQASFDHKRLWFASGAFDDELEKQTSLPVPVKDLKFLRDNLTLQPNIVDFVENLKVNIDMIKVQCSLIEVSTTPQGTQTFDLPLNLKRQRGENKARKDSYSAVLLGNWGLQILKDIRSIPKEEEYEGWTPEIF